MLNADKKRSSADLQSAEISAISGYFFYLSADGLSAQRKEEEFLPLIKIICGSEISGDQRNLRLLLFFIR
ncbi:hypothetical protein [Desulfovermiculus halophilus]|jgi:hypothetical protein|uniref:hypothetical protein n=1 Tax=Desulfovermiculus halophilus TaxID=339722 RepID=UPI000484F5F4|nr:hypothetical protein [Desulfovermiculus halophilus]